MMFYSQVYRFTFVDWPFFGCLTVTSFVALVCSTGFACVCQHNYDKGLAQWSTCSLFFIFFTAFRRYCQSTDLVTVYLEQTFGKDDFDPDLFPTDEIEKEWDPNSDRASIYKAAIPELLKDSHPGTVA